MLLPVSHFVIAMSVTPRETKTMHVHFLWRGMGGGDNEGVLRCLNNLMSFKMLILLLHEESLLDNLQNEIKKNVQCPSVRLLSLSTIEN